MSKLTKQRIGVAALILAAAGGCNPFLLPGLLMRGEPTTPPEYALSLPEKVADEEERPARVAVLVSAEPTLPPELIGVQGRLTRAINRTLAQSAQEHETELEVVPASQVEKYLRDVPDWQTRERRDLAKALKADYVLTLHVNEMSLLKRRAPQFYQASTSIHVELHSVHDKLDGPAYQKFYERQYPKSRPVEVSEQPMANFRSAFLGVVARELAWKFVPHYTQVGVGID